MSLIERIAEINRINTQLLIKNDRISRNAHTPDQTVRQMMTPLENEIVADYEERFPNNFDENGVYRKYVMPDTEPELEEEPPMIKDDEVRTALENLDEIFTTVTNQLQIADNKMKTLDKEKADAKKLCNEEKMSKENYRKRLLELEYEKTSVQKQRAILYTKLVDVEKRKSSIHDDVMNHNANVLEIKKRNAMKVQEYHDNLSFLNKGAFSTQKGENESEADYLERLKQTAM